MILLTVFGSVASSCSWGGTYGPGPDSNIVVTTIGNAEYSAQPQMSCIGPADEIAELGTLCSVTLMDQIAARHVADGAFVIEADERLSSRYVLAVFGYQVSSGPTPSVAFAAVLMPNPASDVRRVSDDWDRAVYGNFAHGEVLHGTVGVLKFDSSDPCDSSAYIGTADLLWRNTTLHFSFSAGYRC